MKPFHDSGLAAWLTFLLLPLRINAQRGREWVSSLALTTKYHLSNTVVHRLDFTLRFFETSQDDTCSYANSSNALTFTTRDVPRVNHCFNLVDLFDGNATEGFVNQTRNPYAPVEGVRCNVQNSEMFNPEANYSSILYCQYQLHQSDNKDLESGHTARRGVRTVEIWLQMARSRGGMDSVARGGCGTTPYSIASFLLYPPPDSSEDDKECVEFSQSGLLSAATGLRSPWIGYNVLVTVVMAAWMVM
ncbi:hypothetical protein E4T42_03749 [Aureobasidium subglaciale]|nr:hypothetical protein E4T42_03749 [Aureobasidium subglaciale]